MTRRRLPGIGLVAALAGLVAGLHAAGEGPLAAPPAGWHDAVAWYEEVGPAVASLSLVRVAALAAGLWLLVVTLVQLSFGVVLAPRAWGLLVRRLAGSTLAAGLSMASLPPGAAAPAERAAIVRAVDDVPGTATVRVTGHAGAPTVRASEPSAPVARPVTVLVAPGDSFWSLAEAAVGAPAEVAPYWRRLVAANRAALVDPANPDLIYPGQRFLLPDH